MEHTPLTWRARGQLWLRLGLRLALALGGAALVIWVGLPLLSLLSPFVLALFFAWALDPVTRTALVILSGCPTAGVTSLFSQNMGKDASLAARQITLSTLLCIITLPLAAVLAQFLAAR